MVISRARLIYVILYITAVLIATVQLRTESNRLFNRYRVAKVKQDHFERQLRSRQLELEQLTSPDAILKHLNKQKEME